MERDAHGASERRLAAYRERVRRPSTTFYDAVQALALLKDEDLERIGKTRAEMVAGLLQDFPTST